MRETDTLTDPFTELRAAEEQFQTARTRLHAAEEARYASIWAALTAAEDLNQLRAALPPTVTVHSIRAAVRRHATGDTGYIQPELFEQPDPETGTATGLEPGQDIQRRLPPEVRFWSRERVRGPSSDPTTSRPYPVA